MNNWNRTRFLSCRTFSSSPYFTDGQYGCLHLDNGIWDLVLFCDVFESLSFESSHRTVVSFFFYQEKIILTASTMLAADSFAVLPPTYILTLTTNTDVFRFHVFRTSPWLIMFHCVFLFRDSFTAPAVCLESLAWWKVKKLHQIFSKW